MSYFPSPPLAAQTLNASNFNPKVLDFLNNRRSTPLALLQSPGPSDDDLKTILRLASRVPDHRRVVPWRFIIFTDTAKQQAAKLIAERFSNLNPQASKDEIDVCYRKFNTAPTIVALIFSPDKTHKTPVWEQSLSVGAVGQNLLLASNAAGFAGVWLTCWYAFDAVIRQQFAVQEFEQIAGFFHLGTACKNPVERPRPVMRSIITHWKPAAR